MYEYALTPSLSISFQRYPYPPAGLVTALPTSWGALPFLLSAPRQLILPCPDREAFWIGLVPSPAGRQHRLRVLVSTASGDRIDVLTGRAASDDTKPPSAEDFPALLPHGIPGISRGDGSWWAFARDTGETPAPSCREIELLCLSVETAEPVRKTGGPGRQYAGPGFQPPPPEPCPPEALPPHIEPYDTSSARVKIVEPGDFQQFGGTQVQPLDEGDYYRGWRLP